jgi:hypothetical protein
VIEFQNGFNFPVSLVLKKEAQYVEMPDFHFIKLFSFSIELEPGQLIKIL